MSQYCCLELTLRLFSQPKIPPNYLSRASCVLPWECRLFCSKSKTFWCTFSASISHWLPLQSQRVIYLTTKWMKREETCSKPSKFSKPWENEVATGRLFHHLLTSLPLLRYRFYAGSSSKESFHISIPPIGQQVTDTDPEQKYISLWHSGQETTLVFDRKKGKVLTLGMILGLN